MFGYFFLSKQAVFLAFHIAKQIEAIRKVKTLLPLDKVLLIHLQYCSRLHGMSLVSQ